MVVLGSRGIEVKCTAAIFASPQRFGSFDRRALIRRRALNKIIKESYVLNILPTYYSGQESGVNLQTSP